MRAPVTGCRNHIGSGRMLSQPETYDENGEVRDEEKRKDVERLPDGAEPGHAPVEPVGEVGERHVGERLLPQDASVQNVHEEPAGEGREHATLLGCQMHQ